MKQRVFHKLRLDEPIETFGWDIDYSKLLTPERGVHPLLYVFDQLFESSNRKYACFFYSITEFGNGDYSGLIALYEDKLRPKLLINPTSQWFDFSFKSAMTFEDELLILRKPAYSNIGVLSGCPFVVIDLKQKHFAFIDFDFTSVYFNLVIKERNTLETEINSPMVHKIAKAAIRAGEQFKLDGLRYYTLNQLDQCVKIYKEEKKAAIKGPH